MRLASRLWWRALARKEDLGCICWHTSHFFSSQDQQKWRCSALNPQAFFRTLPHPLHAKQESDLMLSPRCWTWHHCLVFENDALGKVSWQTLQLSGTHFTQRWRYKTFSLNFVWSTTHFPQPWHFSHSLHLKAFPRCMKCFKCFAS